MCRTTGSNRVIVWMSLTIAGATLLFVVPHGSAADRVGSGSPADTMNRSPLQLDVSPDGKQVFTANRTANSISVIDVASRKVINEIAVGAGPAGVAVSPLGDTVYVTNRLDDTVSVVDVAAGKVTQQIAVANQPYDIIVGKDGTVYVSCVGKDEVVQVNRQRRTRRQADDLCRSESEALGAFGR